MWSHSELKKLYLHYHCLLSPNLSEWCRFARSFRPYIRMTPQWDGLVRSCGKLNISYLHLKKTQGHRNRQGADLPWVAPTLSDTWPFDHVTILRSPDNLKVYISIFKRLIYRNWTWLLVKPIIHSKKELLFFL